MTPTTAIDAGGVPRLRGGRLWRPAGALGARLIVGCVLLYTGLHKVGHIADLARIIHGYRVLYPDLVNLAAMTLAWVEMLVGGLLVIGLLRRSAAVVAAGMFVVFMGAVWLAMLRGIDAPCGCFSVALGSERIGWPVLARDGVLALLCAYLAVHPSNYGALDSLADKS